MSGIHEQCQEDFLKKQIEAWIQTDFGPRCDTFEETCIVCRKWKALDEMFDGLTTPAECDSDPWVTQDRVPARVGVDEYRYASFEEDDWRLATGYWDDVAVHGWKDYSGDTLLLRCRLSQLPEVCDVPEQPAEDPDEWVIQDRVPARVMIDRCWYMNGNCKLPENPEEMWQKFAHDHFLDGKGHGDFVNDGVGTLHVRCRRRDLPKVEQPEQWPKYWTKFDPTDSKVAYVKQVSKSSGIIVYATGHESDEFPWCKDDNSRQELTEAEAMALLKNPEPQPQKTRVRLWMSHNPNGGMIVASETEKAGWQEIHYDADTKQFYVEQQ